MQCRVLGSPPKLREGAEDYALVVGPGGRPVVLAGGVEAVVDQRMRVDHSGCGEPLPLACGPIEIRGLPLDGRSPGQARRHGQEELVGDGVLISPRLAPPDAAVAGGVPAAGHVGEDGLGHREVAGVTRPVVGIDPRQGPPAFIVVVIVEEALRGIHGEGVFDRRAILGRAAETGIVDQHRGGVGGVPPAGGVPEAGCLVVPALERADGVRGVIQIVRRLGGGRQAEKQGNRSE